MCPNGRIKSRATGEATKVEQSLCFMKLISFDFEASLEFMFTPPSVSATTDHIAFLVRGMSKEMCHDINFTYTQGKQKYSAAPLR